jgi:hypothetical protein
MLLIRHPATYPDERAYVFEVVFGEFLGLPWESRAQARDDVEIVVPELDPGPKLLLADGLFTTPQRDWLTARSLPHGPLRSWRPEEGAGASTLLHRDLPVLYGERLAAGSFYRASDDGIELGLDVLGSIFFQLTRYEEVADPARDEHGRYPADASLAVREGFLSRPLVNEYVEILWWALAKLFPRLRRKRRAFRVLPSHDVDWPLLRTTSTPRILKSAAGGLVRQRDPGLAIGRLGGAVARLRGDSDRDPYNSFDFIMQRSELHGLSSAFYFMAGVTEPAFDGRYSLTDPWIAKLIGEIHRRGHEVGLHPSYGTYRDRNATRLERDQLVSLCERVGVHQEEWGGRQHFLRWENPTTWRNWEHAQMAYDSSLGFPRDPGFRCGVCFEYPVYDLLARRPLRLRERPLVVMESSLIDRPGLSEDQALRAIEQLRAQCRRFAGDFTLLWHNSRLVSPRERRLFERAVSTT